MVYHIGEQAGGGGERKSSIPTSDNSQQFNVTTDHLNVRKKPTIKAEVIGKLNTGDTVMYLDEIVVEKIKKDEEYYWFEILYLGNSAWVSSRYLKYEIPDSSLKKYRDDPNEGISEIVENSGIAGTNWANGTAQPGYYQGMALMYGRLYCRLKNSDIFVKEMAKPLSDNPDKDSLKKMVPQLQAAGININTANENERLRYLFVLMFGLGLRESSGRHCCGKDPGAKNTDAETAEAGLFQTSYNVRSISPLLSEVFKNYIDEPRGFLSVFSKGQNCSATNWVNYGIGEGRYFQQLSKECPGFAIEFTAIAMRNTSGHWGPIKYDTHKAEIKTKCDELLTTVQKYIDDNGITEI
ncbi:SH3 domain-containing protein [Elizabethkingia anophelis]|uniref:SH3 domain-containing protein n=1 Tax=Elizabethkingia anophelis TaxID=1117645 RepID=UPI0024E20E30|nr:SH3 domain-containing protein [Elizabethkingia anophelis]